MLAREYVACSISTRRGQLYATMDSTRRDGSHPHGSQAFTMSTITRFFGRLPLNRTLFGFSYTRGQVFIAIVSSGSRQLWVPFGGRLYHQIRVYGELYLVIRGPSNGASYARPCGHAINFRGTSGLIDLSRGRGQLTIVDLGRVNVSRLLIVQRDRRGLVNERVSVYQGFYHRGVFGFAPFTIFVDGGMDRRDLALLIPEFSSKGLASKFDHVDSSVFAPILCTVSREIYPFSRSGCMVAIFYFFSVASQGAGLCSDAFNFNSPFVSDFSGATWVLNEFNARDASFPLFLGASGDLSGYSTRSSPCDYPRPLVFVFFHPVS